MSTLTGLPHSIETFSGRFVDTKNPDPRTIDLEDVAHALGSICRFGGHAKRFYSVAEHAVYCSHYLEAQGADRLECLAGLHHDDPEFALGDIPRPLKPLLGKAYKTLSDRMERAIVTGLGLPFPAGNMHTDAIKEADNAALVVEAAQLMTSKGAYWFEDDVYARLWGLGMAPASSNVPYYWRGGMHPTAAKRLFLDRHKELTS